MIEILDEDLLREECVEVARNTMFQRKPIDYKVIEDLANAYYKEAIDLLEFIEGQNCDPNILVRAVRYIAYTHTYPTVREDTYWFSDYLSVLIELACPNLVQSKKSSEFLFDIRNGIDRSLKEVLKNDC